MPPDGVGDGRWFIAMFLGAAALVALLFFGFIAVALAVSDPAAPAAATTVDLTLSEFAIEGNFNAPPRPVTFNVSNGGTMVHDIVVTGLGKTAPINAGGTDTLVLPKLAPGTYEIFCDLPGHNASGMVTTLKVAYPAS